MPKRLGFSLPLILIFSIVFASLPALYAQDDEPEQDEIETEAQEDESLNTEPAMQVFSAPNGLFSISLPILWPIQYADGLLTTANRLEFLDSLNSVQSGDVAYAITFFDAETLAILSDITEEGERDRLRHITRFFAEIASNNPDNIGMVRRVPSLDASGVNYIFSVAEISGETVDTLVVVYEVNADTLMLALVFSAPGELGQQRRGAFEVFQSLVYNGAEAETEAE